MGKRVDLKGKKFEDCVVIERAGYVGNGLQYRCECDCGNIFTTSAQQLKAKLISACPDCRKRKIKKDRKAKKVVKKQPVKYTLMNPEKTLIIRGSLGIHSYFFKRTAQVAARVMGAVVVPLSEAKHICR